MIPSTRNRARIAASVGALLVAGVFFASCALADADAVGLLLSGLHLIPEPGSGLP